MANSGGSGLVDYDDLTDAVPAPWVRRTARVGLVTKGVLYFVIGSLALTTALGRGGAVTGSQGAVRTLGGQPFGKALLALATVGLAAYALWRLVQAIFDPEHKGKDASGIATRFGYVVSAISHGSLAVFAFQLVSGGGGGGGDSKRAWISRLLSHEYGRVALMIVGGIIVCVGAYQVFRGAKEKFRKKLETSRMSPSIERWAVRVGKLGLVARGVVFAIMGMGLIKTSRGAGDSQAPSVEGALHKLAAQPFGPYLLGAVAFGLACYGVHMMFAARYRRIPN